MTNDNVTEEQLIWATVMPADADPLPEEEDEVADQTPETEVDESDDE